MSKFFTPEMRRELELKAHGVDPVSGLRVGPGGVPLVSPEEQRSAMQALYKLDRDEQADEKARRDAEEAHRRALAEEAARQQQLDQARELEHRRLDIEEEKAATEKARVFVELLQVAAAAGVPGDKLLETIQAAGQQLLGGPVMKQLTQDADKSTK